MGLGVNWFKQIKIEQETIDYGIGKDINYSLSYLGGDGTSYGYSNVQILQDILMEYGNIEIPYINPYNFNPKTIKKELIKPDVLSKVCSNFLNDPNEKDENDMRSRIEWFKEMSDKGYYFTYDSI
ncbi:TPA: hypothetical protein LA460_000319 [Clostridium botulinum]|nr:hypothetical protein [Clostridium botulinum]HBJ1652923.1 hypothetical protein [Clostridium botulinum]